MKDLGGVKELTKHCFNAVSFSPENRARHYIEWCESIISDTKNLLGDGYTEKVNDKIIGMLEDIASANGRTMSAMITGPANFPTSRNEKAVNSLRNKELALENYLEKLRKNKIKRDKKRAIEESGGELEIAKRKLEILKKNQATMKAVNKIIRKKPRAEKTKEKIAEIVALGLPETAAHKRFEPGNWWGKGFAGFELTNNNAKIKNTEKRIRILEAKETSTNNMWTIEEEGQDVTVKINYDIDRITIQHESKPSREVISEIKKLGFRWSPHYCCWMRKITYNAISSLKRSKYAEEVQK